MTLEQKIERSKSLERIDFTKIDCQNLAEPLIALEENAKIKVEPVWLLPNDYEGTLYADYISRNPQYNHIYVREGLYEKLQVAADSLPADIQLLVRAGHRPIEVQKRLLRDLMNDHKKDNPDASEDQALQYARTYVSDPDIKLPPHCCGAAVDVELYDSTTQKLVDFGSTLNTDDDISYLHSDEITAEQKGNRMLLLRTMLDAGFASYYAEWWHFSYGDQIWAWFYGQPDCLYGLAEV